MKLRLPIALASIALAGGIAFVVQNATAQQPPPGAPPFPPAFEKHAPPHWVLSPLDHAALVDAHIAGLHAGLKLTPDQEKLWPPVEAALRAGAKNAEERREKFKNEPHSDDIIAFLRRISEAETAHGATLKAIADAAAPLYATLSEEQKHRLPLLLPKHHFFGGRFAPPEGPHGWGDGEDEGFAEHELGPRHEGPHPGE